MMAQAQKKETSEVKAFARGIHISPRKVRLVANLVKNLPVEQALTTLRFAGKRAALPMLKLLNSAVANASHNFQIDSSRLFIKNLSVDGGRVFKRFQPRAQGRAMPVRKRTSHLNLILGVSSKALTTRPVGSDNKVATPTSPLPHEGEKKEGVSSFKFWQRKKKASSSPSGRSPAGGQMPPKEDPKGRHYTGFDRRGNMGS